MIDLFFILFTTGMVMIVVIRAMIMDRLIPWFSPDHLARAATASANWLVGAFPSLRPATNENKVAVSEKPIGNSGWRNRVVGNEPRVNVASWRDRITISERKPEALGSWRIKAVAPIERSSDASRASQARVDGWRDRAKQDRTR